MRTLSLSCCAVGAAGLALLLTPPHLFAAQVTFRATPNTVAGDGATVIEARIDPQSKNLNVVEGTVRFKGTASETLSATVETGGSLLTLWPAPAAYLPAERVIMFTGGVPNGFRAEGLLFRMRLYSTVAGDLTISWAGGRAYLNDGRGTAEPVFADPLAVALTAQSPESVGATSPDGVPPQFGATSIGRDPNVYDGKYFVSIEATDDISGVARYEVREGESVTTVTDGVYILRDQNRRTPISITAFDQAGNSATVEIAPRFGWGKIAIVVAILLIGILFAVARYRRKKFVGN